jgi:hypothetical protein
MKMKTVSILVFRIITPCSLQITTSASREHITSNLLRWRWKHYVPPKRWSRRTEQHGAIPEDNTIYHDRGNLRPYPDVSGGQNISFLLQLTTDAWSEITGLLQALQMNWHRITTGAANELAEAYYRRCEWIGRGLLEALWLNWQRFTTGAVNELAEVYYRRCEWTGTGLLQALRINWHRFNTGDANELAQDYYRRCEWTGRGLLQALW